MKFSPKVYDRLKFLAQVVLPGLGTLYTVISGLFKWPNTEEVVGTIIAVDAFLGLILQKSSNDFMNDDSNFAGDLHIVDTEDEGVQTMLAFNPDSSPEDLADQKTVTMKVVKH